MENRKLFSDWNKLRNWYPGPGKYVCVWRPYRATSPTFCCAGVDISRNRHLRSLPDSKHVAGWTLSALTLIPGC